VFRHALRLTRSLHDAEDTAGIVFLEAWRRRESMREVDGSVIGWLLVTTNNVHRNSSRASRHDPPAFMLVVALIHFTLCRALAEGRLLRAG